LQTTDSNVTQAVRTDAPWNPPLSSAISGLATVMDVGRMFQLPNDVVAAVATQNDNGTLVLSVFIYDPVQGTNLAGAVPTELPWGEVDFAALADFTGDGYADLVIHNASGALRVATAKDVTQMNQGLAWGPEIEAGAHGGSESIAFAVGDVRGDGQRQIAMITLGPGDQGLALNILTVNPTTLAIAQASSITLAIPDSSVIGLFPSLAAGRFGTTLHDQLVLVYGQGVFSSVTTKVVTIDLDASLQPTVKATLDLGIQTNPGGSCWIPGS
jgi:hypothetical protein